jgi:EAL and modified HD-GYP domain-containing signal transduction protein
VDVFVARQPIFDRQRNLYGYELLYRSDPRDTEFDGTDSEIATKQVISSTILALGLENLLCGKRAFINFDARLLREGTYLNLPCGGTVIEILETVDPTDEVIELCRGARERGYTIALDDFISSSRFDRLIELAQLIKVDVKMTSQAEQRRLLRTYKPRGIAMLAEKVETYQEFEWTREAGYDYFQGYFFARPSVIQSHQIPANKLHCLRLLTEVQKPELDFKRLEAMIRVDVALTYRLLRYVNSASFSHRMEIKSIENALAILGSDNLRRWAALATLPMLATDKPGEVATLSVLRARFCEFLIKLAGLRQESEAFLMGMFSLLDALLDKPLQEALVSAGVGSGITQALLGTAPVNDMLARIYRLTRRYELGDWDEVEEISRACGFTGSAAGAAYVEAATWAQQMLIAACD